MHDNLKMQHKVSMPNIGRPSSAKNKIPLPSRPVGTEVKKNNNFRPTSATS